MTDHRRDDPFRPNLTRTESRAESVSRIARGMIDEEVARREAKTARLKAARLAREADTPTPAEPSPAAPVLAPSKGSATKAAPAPRVRRRAAPARAVPPLCKPGL